MKITKSFSWGDLVSSYPDYFLRQKNNAAAPRMPRAVVEGSGSGIQPKFRFPGNIKAGPIAGVGGIAAGFQEPVV